MKIEVAFTKHMNPKGEMYILCLLDVTEMGNAHTFNVIPRGNGREYVDRLTSPQFSTAKEAQEWAQGKTYEVVQVLRAYRDIEVPKNWDSDPEKMM